MARFPATVAVGTWPGLRLYPSRLAGGVLLAGGDDPAARQAVDRLAADLAASAAAARASALVVGWDLSFAERIVSAVPPGHGP